MARAVPLFLILGVVLAGLSFVPAPAAAAAAFYETAVASDTADDFRGNGALDIVGVYFSEKYQFSKDDLRGEDVLVVRFELRSITDHVCGTKSMYTATFKAGGTARAVSGGMESSAAPGDEQCSRLPTGGTGPVKLLGNNVTVTVPMAAVGLGVGGQATEICAKSMAVPTAGQEQAQDVVPFDNANLPQSACPASGLPSYPAKGVFAFVTVASTNGLFQYSVNGAEAKYSFDVTSHPSISGDQIGVYFKVPTGWSVAPSQGTTGATPIGSFTGASDGKPRAFSFTLSNTAGHPVGTSAQVIMDVVSDSGGHANLTAIVEVSGEKIEDPALTVSLATPGPFKAGATSEVRVQFAYDNSSVSGATVKIDLLQGTKRVGTFAATEKANGTYAALIQFPGAGSYTLDAYLASESPSPHQAFLITVEKSGGLLPANALWTLVVVLAGVALARRRLA